MNQWAKKAVLLSFRLWDNAVVEGGAAGAPAYDKVPSKFDGWGANRFADAGVRVVPGAVVRRGAFVGRGAVLMPSFVNIGAHVGEGAMIDTWATVGSCAQIGRNVHLSGGAGIGGVLEPLQAEPVIIGDGAFIGAQIGGGGGRAGGRGRGAVHGRLPGRVDPRHRPRDGRGDVRRGAALLGRRARRGTDGGPSRRARRSTAR